MISSQTALTLRRRNFLLAGLALGASAALPKYAAAQGASTLVIAWGSGTNTWDPATILVGNPYPEPIYDPLIMAAADGSYAPWLATEWSYASPTEFAMTLRDDVSFSDGEKFDAAAVKINLERALTIPGLVATDLQDIEQVAVIDATHVVISLKNPNPNMPYLMSVPSGYMASPKALAAGTIATDPIGSGPYILDKANSVTGDHITFIRNPGYWNATAFPYETVVLRQIVDGNARLNAVRAGQANVAEGAVDLIDAAKASGLTVQLNNFDIGGLFILDHGGELVPALADVRVRKAINMAIDRDAIVEALGLGYYEVLHQLFPPYGGVGYVAELDSVYRYDPDGARALMNEAGFSGGFDMQILSSAGLASITAAIAAYLGDIGIRSEIVNRSDDFWGALVSKEYPIAVGNAGVRNGYLDAAPWLFPGGLVNPFNNVHQPFIDLYADAAAEVDPTAKEAKFAALAREVHDQAWEALVFIPTHSFFLDTKTTGLFFSPLLANPHIWGLKPVA